MGDERLGVFYPDIEKSVLVEADTCDDGALSQALTELLFINVEMGTGYATRPRRRHQ